VVRCDEPMSLHTTFRVGGPADCFVEVRSEQALVRLWDYCLGHGLQPLVLGCGSNLLVRDGGIRGLVLKLGGDFYAVRVAGTSVTAGAAATLKAVAAAAAEAGLSGLEFAEGIPGSVGGAVFMNAGAYGGQMADVVAAVRVLDRSGRFVTWRGADLAFDYRRSSLQEAGMILTQVDLALRSGDPAAIKETMNDYETRRAAKQPLEFPSAGSVFKRPPGHYVGAMVQESGLKGVRIGDAQVSEKHAGFIVNRGQATAKDILALIGLVQERIKAAYGVELETELRIVGEP